jgi:putative DNA primase/helicase
VVKETKQKQKQKPPTPRAANQFATEAIPLENCLAKSNRDLLRGVSEGGRNDAGATLARDLIGTADYLISIGQSYIRDARDLFDRFCSGCSPSLDDIEANTIWDSAQSDSPSPSCQTEGVDNILTAWNGKNSSVTEDDKRRCPYFETSPAGGLWRVSLTKDDDADGYDDESAPMKKKRDRIGNHLACIAYVDNPESSGAALYLEFQTVRNKTTKWTMPRGYIVSDTAAMLSELFNMGYQFKLDKKKYLIEYLAGLGADVAKTYTIVDSTGWVNDRYVSQHKTYGDGDLKFRDIEPTSEATTEIKGNLDDWKSTVGVKCAGNSRLLLGLGVAFAAPLLALTGMESGGFHLVGDSSAGKTTTLKVAVSVTGEKHIPHWRTTTNGLEAIATAHNHSLLPLDEIAQADPRQVGEIAYMLANGQGKTRMTKSLTNRKPKTWELLFLSSGELGMGAYMAQAGVTMKGGQEVRMPDIPAVPFGSPFGVFETIHGYESSKEFARSLESGSEQNRGVAIDVFLTRLLADRSVAFDGELSARVFAVAKKLSEGTLNHAVSPVANRFGLIQVALELAHSYDILPFPIANIDWSIKKIFADWLTNRGGDGSIEFITLSSRMSLAIGCLTLERRMVKLCEICWAMGWQISTIGH